MIDGSVLQSAQKCFEKKSRVVVKMVVRDFVIVFIDFEGFTDFEKDKDFVCTLLCKIFVLSKSFKI